jgi:hypothetical protein
VAALAYLRISFTAEHRAGASSHPCVEHELRWRVRWCAKQAWAMRVLGRHQNCPPLRQRLTLTWLGRYQRLTALLI